MSDITYLYKNRDRKATANEDFDQEIRLEADYRGITLFTQLQFNYDVPAAESAEIYTFIDGYYLYKWAESRV